MAYPPIVCDFSAPYFVKLFNAAKQINPALEPLMRDEFERINGMSYGPFSKSYLQTGTMQNNGTSHWMVKINLCEFLQTKIIVEAFLDKDTSEVIPYRIIKNTSLTK